jgi:hypothetical protein
MHRRTPWLALVLAIASLASGGCTSPTGEDIERGLEAELASVAGDWTGVGPGGLALGFRLTEGAGGAVTGTGTMQQPGAAAVPFTVTGSYQRPTLELAFEGLVYEGRAVRGTFRGEYTTVGGVSDVLVLTGTDYSRSLAVLLQEAAASP